MAQEKKRKAKIAKGAQDFGPRKMIVRELVLAKIVECFKRRGAVQIDTPIFELKETLLGNYGEDQKLIYDLQDQGGEILSLRYDLTVPFARYVGTNNIDSMVRFHIGKVYRRDEPQMNKGRYREFYQVDLDYAGPFDSMVPDAEVLGAMVDVYRTFESLVGPFEIRVSHRKILDGCMEVAGVPQDKFRAISSAIDKLDKEPWAAVRAEMIDVKGLPAEAADKLQSFVTLRGRRELLKELATNDELMANVRFSEGLQDLETLATFLEGMGCLDATVFDLSLARGLDYYTGPIFEAILLEASMGSIGGGGRYDHLLGSFRGKPVPAVGASIGVERLFSIAEQKLGIFDTGSAVKEGAIFVPQAIVDVFVCSIGDGMITERMKLTQELRSSGIKTSFAMKDKMKIGKQLQQADETGCRFAAIIGEDEIKKGVVKLKDFHSVDETTGKANELEVPRSEIIKSLSNWLKEQDPLKLLTNKLFA